MKRIKYAGFTIIELCLTVSLIVILSLIGLKGVSSYQEYTEGHMAGEKLKSVQHMIYLATSQRLGPDLAKINSKTNRAHTTLECITGISPIAISNNQAYLTKNMEASGCENLIQIISTSLKNVHGTLPPEIEEAKQYCSLTDEMITYSALTKGPEQGSNGDPAYGILIRNGKPAFYTRTSNIPYDNEHPNDGLWDTGYN